MSNFIAECVILTACACHCMNVDQMINDRLLNPLGPQYHCVEGDMFAMDVSSAQVT